MTRRDTMTVLDDLRTRVQQSYPPDVSTQMNRLVPRRPTLESISSSSPTSSEFIPSGVSIPEAEESRGGISRWLSMGRHSKRNSTASATSSFVATLLPTPEMLGPGILQSMDAPPSRPVELAAAEVQLPFARDIKLPMRDPDTNRLHPALQNDSHSSISRHQSSRSTSTQNSQRSDFSDEKIAILREEDEEDYATSPQPSQTDFAFPSHQQKQNHIPASSYARQLQPIRSPTETVSTVSMLPSPITLGPGRDNSFDFSRHNRPISSSSGSLYSNAATPQPLTIVKKALPSKSTIHVAAPLLVGRPSKGNNYWGFCKGSWTIREEWRKGLSLCTVPTGMYTTKTVWRCKSCTFEGDVYGQKKPFDIDQRVHVVNVGGTSVRYKWLFLAKSHTKRKALLPSLPSGFLAPANNADEKHFSCVFCIGEGRESPVFGNVEILCGHLVQEHADGMSEKLKVENKCIVGRKANDAEDFDVNIPAVLCEV